MKKFEIGLSDIMNIDEYRKIFSKYNSYIDYLYFSVPLGVAYQTRARIYQDKSTDEAVSYLKKVLSLAKTYGIKLELCLNSYWLNDEQVATAIMFTQDVLKIDVDAVVFLTEYANIVKKMLPDVYHICSYNNGYRTVLDLDKVPDFCDEIVFIPMPNGNREIWRAAREKGLNVRILLNNGCSPNCATCRNSKYCENTFTRNIGKNGPDYTIATQSTFPIEVHEVLEKEDNVTSYKLSSRPCEYEYMDNMFDRYINNAEFKAEEYELYARLAHNSRFFFKNVDKINIDKVMEIKGKIWGTKFTKAAIKF